MKNFKPEPEYGIQWYHVLLAIILGPGVIALTSLKIAGYTLLVIVAYGVWRRIIESH